MTRTIPAHIRSFAGGRAIDRRFLTTGSLNPATETPEVTHFVSRRRSSSIGGAA